MAGRRTAAADDDDGGGSGGSGGGGEHDRQQHQRRSILVCYALWSLGGPYGFHLAYLNRPAAATCYALTLGGCLIGHLLDVFRLPSMVRETNGYLSQSPEYSEIWSVRRRYHPRRPPVMSYAGLLWQFLLGNQGAFLAGCLCPRDCPDVFVEVSRALGAAFGVMLGASMLLPPFVSSSPLSRGGNNRYWWLPVAESLFTKSIQLLDSAAFSSKSSRAGNNGNGDDGPTRLTSNFYCVVLSIVTVYFTRSWATKRKAPVIGDRGGSSPPRRSKKDAAAPPPERSTDSVTSTSLVGKKRHCGPVRVLCRHVLILTLISGVYTVGILQHGKLNVRTADGEVKVVYIKEAIVHIIKSPVWSEAGGFGDLWEAMLRTGNYEAAWENLKLRLDPDGRKRACNELGIGEGDILNSTGLPPPNIVKKAYRTEALRYHPDKLNHQDPPLSEEEKEEATEKFVRIQEAYDLLRRLQDDLDVLQDQEEEKQNVFREGDEL